MTGEPQYKTGRLRSVLKASLVCAHLTQFGQQSVVPVTVRRLAGRTSMLPDSSRARVRPHF